MKLRISAVDILIAFVLAISLAFTGVALALLYSTHNFVPQGVQPAQYVTVLRLREAEASSKSREAESPLFTGVQFLIGPTPQELLSYQYQSERSEETLIAWTATIILMLTGAAFCWSALKSMSDRQRFIAVAYATGASVQDITFSFLTPIWRNLLLCVLFAAVLIVFGESFLSRRNVSIELWVLIPILMVLSAALALLVHAYVMRTCGTQTVSYLLETET